MVSAEEERSSLVRKLLVLGNQLLAVAGEIAETRFRPDRSRQDRDEALGGLKLDSPNWLVLAKDHYDYRRKRDRHFPPKLFGEPAWDILLDLYINAKLSRRVSITSACIGSHVAPTTALRWLQMLEDQGMIERHNDLLDARRSFVTLTIEGYSKMTTFLAKSNPAWSREDHLGPTLIERQPAHEDFNQHYIEST